MFFFEFVLRCCLRRVGCSPRSYSFLAFLGFELFKFKDYNMIESGSNKFVHPPSYYNLSTTFQLLEPKIELQR